MLLQIHWNPSPEIFTLGPITVLYYSALFASGMLIGFYWVKNMYKKEGLPTEELDTLFIYVFFGTLIGARLGHCLFYEPEYYLSHPLEMLLPFRWDENGFEFTGYRGLASHGGILAVFIAIWLFSRKYGRNFWGILDKVSIAGAFAGACIRMGNFMNSEIIGKPTDGDWGIIFDRVDNIPRHPTQLYEAGAYILICVTLWITYSKVKGKYKDGFVFGLFFTLLFLARFFIEYFKINQVAFEEGMTFNMGQLLSVPGILLGLIMMFLSRKSPSA